MKKVHGFTLIELMIVIAILGILLAIAIPAYQDYTIRTKVTEGLNLATAAKVAVYETRMSNGAGTWPTDAAAAGYVTAATDLVSGIAISNGVITITYAAPAEVAGLTVKLTPTMGTGGIVQWACNDGQAWGTAGTVPERYVPSNCR